VANFVDGRKFPSISGQLIHVPVRGTSRVGLRRGVALDGDPLVVEVDSPGVVRIQPGRAHGDIRIFTLTGVNIGDTILKAVAKDGAVLDRVEVHVHRPRARQLPRFDDLFENYAGDEESSDDFRKRIGGQADNPHWAQVTPFGPRINRQDSYCRRACRTRGGLYQGSVRDGSRPRISGPCSSVMTSYPGPSASATV